MELTFIQYVWECNVVAIIWTFHLWIQSPTEILNRKDTQERDHYWRKTAFSYILSFSIACYGTMIPIREFITYGIALGLLGLAIVRTLLLSKDSLRCFERVISKLLLRSLCPLLVLLLILGGIEHFNVEPKEALWL